MFKYNQKCFAILSLLCILLNACQNKSEKTPQFRETDNPAVNSVSRQIADSPDDPDLYYARAELFYESAAYDEAIGDLETALSYDSMNIRYLHLLADSYLDYFKSKEAIATLKQTLDYHPQHIVTHLKLSEFQLILKQYDESMQTLARVLNLDPRNPEAYFMMGLNYKETGDTARAINSFQETVEIDPDIVDAWVLLGQLQGAMGNDIAQQYFESALIVSPNNINVMHAKADYLSDQEKLKEAIEVYQEITRIDPQYEEAYFNMGLLYMDLDSIGRARKQFDILVKVAPLHIRGYYYKGLCSELLAQHQEAKNSYAQALRMAPDYADAQAGLERVNALLSGAGENQELQ